MHPSEKGGALLYLKDQINCKPRKVLDNDLNKCGQLESTFVEIINKGKKRHNNWLHI